MKRVMWFAFIVLAGIVAAGLSPHANAANVQANTTQQTQTIDYTLKQADKAEAKAQEFTFYTCTRHPNVRGEKGGKCPICGKALVEKTAKVQATCPVMNSPIDKKYFVDHEGLRIYFCHDDCVDAFKKKPAKYLKIIRKNGEEPESAPKQ